MLNAVSFQHAVSTTRRDFLKRRASCKLQVRHGYAAQLRKGSASGNHNHSRSLPLSFNIRRGLIWNPEFFCWIFWIYVAVLGGKVLPKTIFFLDFLLLCLGFRVGSKIRCISLGQTTFYSIGSMLNIIFRTCT